MPPPRVVVQAPAVTTTVSARTAPAAVCTVTPSASSSMRSAGVLPPHLAAAGGDASLEFCERDGRAGDTGIGRVQHGVFEPHAPPAA